MTPPEVHGSSNTDSGSQAAGGSVRDGSSPAAGCGGGSGGGSISAGGGRIRGRRLGVDVGSVRVGVAVSDPDGLLATPLATVARDLEHGSDLRILADLCTEYDVVEVVVGLPRTLAGREGQAAVAAREFAAGLAEVLAEVLDVAVLLTDERLTTVVATQQLRASGRPGRRQRAVVDQAAAVAILQGWLDAGS